MAMSVQRSARSHDIRDFPSAAHAPRAAAPGVARLDASPGRLDAPSRPLASSARLRRARGAPREARLPAVGASPPGPLRAPAGMAFGCGLDARTFRASRVTLAAREPAAGSRASLGAGASPPRTLSPAGAGCSAVATPRVLAPPDPSWSRWGASQLGGCGWTPCPTTSASPMRRSPEQAPSRSSMIFRALRAIPLARALALAQTRRSVSAAGPASLASDGTAQRTASRTVQRAAWTV